MTEKRTVHIHVTGEVNSGKSTIACNISRILADAGFVCGIDGSIAEGNPRAVLRRSDPALLASIAPFVRVVISEGYVPKPNPDNLLSELRAGQRDEKRDAWARNIMGQAADHIEEVRQDCIRLGRDAARWADKVADFTGHDPRLPDRTPSEPEPSDSERAAWPEQTRAYVESLELFVKSVQLTREMVNG